MILLTLLASCALSLQQSDSVCLGHDCPTDLYAPTYHWNSSGYFEQTNPLFGLGGQCYAFDRCPGQTREECRASCYNYMLSLHRGCEIVVNASDRRVCRQQANEEYSRCLLDCDG